MNPEDLRRCNDTYLGDGVYASCDGYQIWLRTPRDGGWHEIAMEPEVLTAFDEYREKLRDALSEPLPEKEAQ